MTNTADARRTSRSTPDGLGRVRDAAPRTRLARRPGDANWDSESCCTNCGGFKQLRRVRVRIARRAQRSHARGRAANGSGPAYQNHCYPRWVVHAVRQQFTFQEYLDLEARSQVKHEYLDGVAWALAGGSPDHTAIAANVIGLLTNALRERPCRVFTSDLRVRVKATGLGTYPDVTVVCGPLETDTDDPNAHTVVNPSVVVEVLSKSTEQYDRGEKLWHYQRIESLKEIVLLAHDEPRAEIWRRDGARWTLDVRRASDRVSLSSLDCELPLSEIYRDPTRSP